MALAEQPADWTEPGAHPVVPGVFRVPLPLRGGGLHAVNVYVLEGPRGPVLIDSGWAMPDTEQALTTALGALGHSLSDISQVLVTHAHWDHYSQALALREALGTRVRIGRGEQVSINAHNPADGLHIRQIELLRRCGAPELAHSIETWEVSTADWDVPRIAPDAWLDHGEQVTVDSHELEVFATPGHTRGHVVLRDKAKGLLFAGDHVLPHITPSIGLENEPEPKPLRSYLASLRLVQDLPDTLLLPAHGPVTHSVHTRVEQLITHHEERLDEIAGHIKTGARTAFEAAKATPWTRRKTRLEDLDVFSQMLAVLETEAHLDLLADEGVLTVAEIAGVRHYAVS